MWLQNDSRPAPGQGSGDQDVLAGLSATAGVQFQGTPIPLWRNTDVVIDWIQIDVFGDDLLIFDDQDLACG